MKTILSTRSSRLIASPQGTVGTTSRKLMGTKRAKIRVSAPNERNLATSFHGQVREPKMFSAGAIRFALITALAATLLLQASAAPVEPGFTPLFDGETLNGWTLTGGTGHGYVVKDNTVICPADGGGKLFSEKEYSNFIFRFEFKLSESGNNGIGIRAPLTGETHYQGMEIQVLHDDGTQYRDGLRSAQYHGSVYDVVSAKRGSLKAPGEWNTEEILAHGRHIRVTVNRQVIVDTNLNDVSDTETLQRHPGILSSRGHIGFLGHNSHVEFRNIRIMELSADQADNTPPPNFTALFNGVDLAGWKGLVGDPPKRAKMSAAELAEAQEQADREMRDHWRIKDDALVFDGKGKSLCTAKDYADFELWVDWKILPKGDSGIYLRGSPQVQIWDSTDSASARNRLGSGALYNNQKNPSDPSKLADKPIGEWNSFHILMVGEKVHVFLNDELVVNNVTMENYWERNNPIYPTGQIELQNHGNTLYFKNIYVREIPRH